ncbi:flagellar hook-associated 2-like protein [Hydrogenovibrio sp. SC-1]|uniref:flagellar filament capping protein FliD n=1 Tax=Hydrogenovibrio sp. SC-1 TaxID=2065820 RepID=UPI000C7D3047|nr:flagellar filament capping protein FliD [Hydrogenovibrio sp. SC-1]PLA73914.1 flagellar hook-associated 2-like protein [Hydrogenovibrio sp. SC-1]
MANEIGSTLLNSLTNSTFDIGNMAKVLAEADVATQRGIVEKGNTKATTELSALKYLEVNLNAFNSYVTDLSSPDIFLEKQVSSTDETAVTATASTTAVAGSFSVIAEQLAQSHTQVANQSFSSQYDSLTNGTFTINVGGQVHNITVDATNNTLEGLQKTINNGDYGITASVINNGGSYQMMFSSKNSGASGEFSVSGITEFDTLGLTTTVEAQDAIMNMNGVSITSSTNTFEGVIDGVSINLNSAKPGQVNTINISQDATKVTDTIKSFVDVYNQLETIFDEMGAYDASKYTEEELQSDQYLYYGDLAGNNILRQIRSELKNTLSGAINEISGNINSLGVVGISFALDGQMQLDETKLNDVAASDVSAFAALFATGGSSTDTLVNVLGGSDKTQTGTYALDITQLATRAQTAGNAATVSTDEQVSGDKITNSANASIIDVGASLDITIGGVNQNIDLSALAQNYNSKDEVATALQGALDTAFGGSVATVSYDVAQSRFEIAANSGQGAVTVNSATGLVNQGFQQATAYAGEGLVDLTAAPVSFDIKVDDSISTTINIAQQRYTLNELASVMASNINANTDVSTNGNSVTVSATGGALSIASNRFGGYSSIDITNVSAGFANAGFAANLTATGQSVDGTLTTASGTINIGAYADSTDGRRINISDFAVIGTNDAEVRGLSFEVLGGAIGARGNLSFSKGFASRLEETVNNYFDTDTGLIARRTDALDTKIENYKERNTALDERYDKLEAKYRLQFSMLQSIMSNAEATRSQLTAQFSNNNN